MKADCKRDKVLIVGSTGSLGQPIVSELIGRGVQVRLMGRSQDSFVKAGYLRNVGDEGFSPSIDADIVVCHDVTRLGACKDEWFQDVCFVICVARPRSLQEGDDATYCETIVNLCNAAKSNNVPRMLLHGIPFVESDIISPSPTMSLLRKAEKSARDVLEESSTSLTVSRICEHTEILHLLEAVEMIGQLDYMRTFFLCNHQYIICTDRLLLCVLQVGFHAQVVATQPCTQYHRVTLLPQLLIM
jgi:hypothetical protein